MYDVQRVFGGVRTLVIAVVLAAAMGCGDDPADEGPVPPTEATVTIEGSRALTTVDDAYLSFAVDTAQVVGGLFWDPAGGSSTKGSVTVPAFDFSRPRLRKLARELAPAMLRIGGSAADETYYDLSDSPVHKPPGKHDAYVLTRKMVDGVGAFAEDLGLRLMVTLSAGLDNRGGAAQDGPWSPAQARTLVRYMEHKGYPVDVWELGNELNGFGLMFGVPIDAKVYAADLKTARDLIAVEAKGDKLAGPSCAYWPKLGDFNGFYSKLMPHGGKHLDIVTWHYYPQQSVRCPLRDREAGPEVMLKPEHLDTLDTWAAAVEKDQKTHAAGAEVWLGETGNAQCGGEPGVSDAYAGVFWWLDQLGRLAARGHRRVVRQTLSGSDYGLLTDTTLDPKPDYWASVLWRRLMGRRVLGVKLDTSELAASTVRAYAHCARPGTSGSGPGGVTVLVINLAQEAVRVKLPGVTGKVRRYVLSADALSSKQLKLNGTPLSAAADGTLPRLDPSDRNHGTSAAHLDLPARTIAFAVLPDVQAQACR